MKHLGDITKINGYSVYPAEVVIGGSPCQNLSVAGDRKGLQGNESCLFFEQIRLIKEMRKADYDRGRTDVDIRPRYMVWENVPGAFSSNGGQDFKAVLRETISVVEPKCPDIPFTKNRWTKCGCITDVGGKWSIAWRVLDAQFFGVPQRRRRIALVADFGGMSAPEILFERKGLSRDFEKSGEAWKAFTRNSEKSTGNAVNKSLVLENHRQDARYSGPLDIAPTVLNAYGTGGNNVPLCVQSVGYEPYNGKLVHNMTTTICTSDEHSTSKKSVIASNPGMLKRLGGHWYNGISGTLAASMGDNQMAVAIESCTADNNIADCAPLIALDRASFNQGINAQFDFELSDNGINSTLTAKGPGAVAVPISFYPQMKAESQCPRVDCANTLVNGTNHGYQNGLVDLSYTVRRLTPLECERLQGFPDNWTDIGNYVDSKGKKRKTCDTNRYKALGNSIALPPWFYVLSKLNEYCKEKTMASLFDGIGGFPLIWETLNGKGSCLWVSEIEEFPIAVTKYHFGDV